MNKILFKRRLYSVLIIVWMAIIFCFSAQNGSSSAQLSSSITFQLLRWIYPGFRGFALEKQLVYLAQFHTLIRKIAHMTEYGVLCLLFLQYWKTYAFTPKRIFLFAFLGSSLYAVLDECHQLFIPGRIGSFIDVMIDCCGVLAVLMMFRLFKKKSYD